MADELLQPLESLITGGTTIKNTATTTATTAPTPTPTPPHPSLTQPTAPASLDNPCPSLAPKRQRRPSARLGKIGDKPAAIFLRLARAASQAPMEVHEGLSSAPPSKSSVSDRPHERNPNGEDLSISSRGTEGKSQGEASRVGEEGPIELGVKFEQIEP
ncbi:hypothetical protein TorRG33x02_261230 [Trema orientale]|uniref:Uncharacterized protein n=1 Tax=Trema orientale TaxID=63057 RepID=A0A2P5D6C2_TREOI|nr:hypothetical protein TorRG33x02_261230 [Trema orientale]